MYSSYFTREMARARINDWLRDADAYRRAAATRPARPPRNPRTRIHAFVHAKFPRAATRHAAA